MSSMCLDKGTLGVMWCLNEFKRADDTGKSIFDAACHALSPYKYGVHVPSGYVDFVFFRAGDETLYYTYMHDNTQRFYRFNNNTSELELVKEIDLPFRGATTGTA